MVLKYALGVERDALLYRQCVVAPGVSGTKRQGERPSMRVEVGEHVFVAAAPLRPSEPFDALDEYFTAGWTRIAQERHRFIDIVSQRHGIGVNGLGGSTKLRLHVGRG